MPYEFPKIQPRILFFNLPRELRDAVYAELWQQRCQFLHAHFPYSNFSIYLRYLGYCKTGSSIRPPGRGSSKIVTKLPTWLLCNKQFMIEAMQGFISHAEWFCNGHIYNGHFREPRDTPLLATLKLPTPLPNEMTVHAKNLKNYPEPRGRISKFIKESCCAIADALLKRQEHGTEAPLQRLRVTGYDSVPEYDPYSPAPSIIQNACDLFKSVRVPRFEVEIYELDLFRHLVYLVTGREEQDTLQWEIAEYWVYPHLREEGVRRTTEVLVNLLESTS